jgi:hypothetical protein
MSSSTVDNQIVAAANVRATDDTLTVDLSDGRVVSVPMAWYPRLSHGTLDERNNWRLIGGGRGIHWPDLDEDISVEGLLAGKPSGESQTSFQKWLDSRDSSYSRSVDANYERQAENMSGTEAFKALKAATSQLPSGSAYRVSPRDAKNLMKLTTSDLANLGYDHAIAEDVSGALLTGDIGPLGKSMGLHLTVGSKASQLDSEPQ